MTESKSSVAERELAEAQKIQTWILSIKAAADTIVEQGLWIAFSVNLLAISGKLYKERDRFLARQRTQVIEVLKWLTAKENTIPFTDLTIPAARSIPFRFLKPLAYELDNVGHDEGGEYYAKLDPIPTMILVFMLPGALRLIVSQIGEILPG